MKVCITGGTGMVGQCIKDVIKAYPKHEFIFLSRKSNNIHILHTAFNGHISMDNG